MKHGIKPLCLPACERFQPGRKAFTENSCEVRGIPLANTAGSTFFVKIFRECHHVNVSWMPIIQ